MSKNAPLFPIFLKLEGRTCLVVGAGPVGEGKIRSLLEVRCAGPRCFSKCDISSERLVRVEQYLLEARRLSKKPI